MLFFVAEKIGLSVWKTRLQQEDNGLEKSVRDKQCASDQCYSNETRLSAVAH